jgi:Tol biopolymer transport system component
MPAKIAQICHFHSNIHGGSMKIFPRILLIALCTVAFLSACVNRNDDQPCSRIAYVRFDSSHNVLPDIYSVCENGSHPVQLTDDPANDVMPAWSPDGQKIAFVSDRTGQYQIFMMAADGSNVEQLTDDLENDTPMWLPEGGRIAFRTTDGQGLWWWRELELNNRQITMLSEPSYDFFFQKQTWSPDGKKIAYMSMQEQAARNDGSSQIHIKNSDGSGDKALTDNIWENANPVWSPDGKQIAFLSEMHGEYNIFALYVMHADGSHVRQLSQPIYGDTYTVYSWSPDGKNIVISDINTSRIEMITVADGSIRCLIPEGDSGYAYYWYPSWQPKILR